MKPPGSANAFTSDELTTANCQSRSARLVLDAIDRPNSVTKRSTTESCTIGSSESTCAALASPIARSSDCETEHAVTRTTELRRRQRRVVIMGVEGGTGQRVNGPRDVGVEHPAGVAPNAIATWQWPVRLE